MKLGNLLTDILRAEYNGNDLQEDENLGIIVCAERENGTLYELGNVSATLIYQSPEVAKACINKIKFQRTNHEH